MDVTLIGRFLSGLGEAGIFGLGWIGFLWAMMQLKYERARYQTLVVHIIEYFTKVSILKEFDDDDSQPSDPQRRADPFRSVDGAIGRIFGDKDHGKTRR
jgi:hypothetical protein